MHMSKLHCLALSIGESGHMLNALQATCTRMPPVSIARWTSSVRELDIQFLLSTVDYSTPFLLLMHKLAGNGAWRVALGEGMRRFRTRAGPCI